MTDVEALYTANHDRLFRYFCRAVGHIEDARELTQDVFVRVSRTVISSGPEGALRGWLFQIARNLALDHHRRRHRRPQVEALTDQGLRPPSQDTSAQVNEALAALSYLDRDVFLMREVAGFGYEDIASACGLSPDAVESDPPHARAAPASALGSDCRKARRTDAADGSQYVTIRPTGRACPTVPAERRRVWRPLVAAAAGGRGGHPSRQGDRLPLHRVGQSRKAGRVQLRCTSGVGAVPDVAPSGTAADGRRPVADRALPDGAERMQSLAVRGLPHHEIPPICHQNPDAAAPVRGC